MPAALTYTYGVMVGATRQGWVIFAAMLLPFVVGFGVYVYAETAPNPILGGAPLLEGKELRNGIATSVLWGQPPPRPPMARSTPCTAALAR
ncbi:MAG: potassium-transporting ATPase subunit KdpA [Caldilineaceae bacterium]